MSLDCVSIEVSQYMSTLILEDSRVGIDCLCERRMDHPENSTWVIAIGNQIGRDEKTTNTAHIAAALGRLGRKVLVWDLDVNYGLMSHFWIPPYGVSWYDSILVPRYIGI